LFPLNRENTYNISDVYTYVLSLPIDLLRSKTNYMTTKSHLALQIEISQTISDFFLKTLNKKKYQVPATITSIFMLQCLIKNYLRVCYHGYH